jgi:hypothetical protein
MKMMHSLVRKAFGGSFVPGVPISLLMNRIEKGLVVVVVAVVGQLLFQEWKDVKCQN